MKSLDIIPEGPHRFNSIDSKRYAPFIFLQDKNRQQMKFHYEVAMVIGFQYLVIQVKYPGEYRPVNIFSIPVRLERRLMGCTVPGFFAEGQIGMIPCCEFELYAAPTDPLECIDS